MEQESEARIDLDRRLQKIYVQRLHEYATPISTVLDKPADIIDRLAFQKVAAALDKDRIKPMIQSSPLWRQQIDIFFSGVLFKTSYTELRLVERAFLSWCKEKEVDRRKVKAIFGIIAEDLEKEDSSVQFSPPLDDGPKSDSAGQSTGTGGTGEVREVSGEVIEKEKLLLLRDQFHRIIVPSGNPDKLRQFLENPAANKTDVWLTENGDTPLHSAAKSKSTKWAKELIDIIMNPDNDTWNCPWRREELRQLVNKTNSQGNTALHLAVENHSTQVALCLIEKGADSLIRNKKNKTPLDAMYENMPKAVIHVLRRTAILPGDGLPDDGNLSLKLDFGSVVGRSCQAVSVEQEPQNGATNSLEMNNMTGSAPENKPLVRPQQSRAVTITQDEGACPTSSLEMDLLAKTVYQNFDSSASVILPHVVVKTFLSLKWKKLRVPIYLLTLFYIFVYLLFTVFAIRIFITRFPYVTQSGNSTTENTTEKLTENPTFWNYLWGISLEPAAGTDLGNLEDSGTSNDALIDPVLAAILMVLTAACFLMEIYEFKLIQELASVTFLQGLYFYVFDLENILQLAFTVAAAFVTSVGFQSEARFSNWTYSIAAYSVVLVWILILLQLGNIYGFGKYVQMLKTVIKRFVEVMATYVCFLAGFSIAFSILFPEDGFATFPTSFFRSVSMMAGELNYSDTFDPENIRPFPLATQFMYFGFTVTVTIVLINLLTGLTVGDVEKILKESDGIQRSIQVQRLYILERMLHKFRFLRCHIDLCVMPETEGSPPTLEKKISDLPPELHKELRLLYADPEEYEKQYLQQE